MRRIGIGLAVVICLVPLGLSSASATTPGTSSNFRLVGHHGLFARGMNSAPAVYRDFFYIGNRSDGTQGRRNPGILVVNTSRPKRPRVVGEVNQPAAGNVGESSRELRVWPQRKMLVVQNVSCSKGLHNCSTPSAPVTPSFKFFDLSGRNAAHPKLLSTYVPTHMPHEFFLWVDPKRRGRAILYYSHSTTDPMTESIVAVDVSRARRGVFREIATWRATHLFSEADRAARDIFTHTVYVSPSGRRAYVAQWGGGMLVLDTSQIAANKRSPQIRLLTPPANSPLWPNISAHAVVKVFGRPLVVVGDEVFGTSQQGVRPFFDKQKQGCPWGWVHVINVARQSQPRVVGEYKIAENEPAFCERPEGQDPQSTFAAHNMTALRNVVFATWYSGGVQAISLANPSRPRRAGFYVPTPLGRVGTEDPGVTEGMHKVAMWSFPIIKNGLVYVVDIRNGLYVLRYTGRFKKEVRSVGFLEGNSNVGDAAALERGRRPR